MPPAQLGFYLDPLDPLFAPRLHWLHGLGVRHLGLDGMGRDSAAIRSQLRAAIADAGLNLLVIHGEPPLVAPDGDDHTLRNAHLNVLDRAVALGAQIVVLHYRLSMDPALDLPDHDRRMVKLLRLLSDRAGEAGLTLALENVPLQFPFGYRMDELLQFLAGLSLPNVRLCLDSGHAHLCGIDVAAAIRDAGDWLLTTHFHDNYGLCRASDPVVAVDRHLVPGLGTINWPAIVQALEDRHFPHPVMFEGVRTTPQGRGPDFELATSLTLTNWRLFERIAHTLSQPIVR